MTGLTLTNLTKRYGDRAVLDDVSVAVEPGELVCVLGPSGSGKSTLLSIVAGLVEPDAGEVRIGDRIVNDPRPRVPSRERGVGMVFQELALWPHLSAEAHLRFVAPRRDPRPLLEALEIAHLADARPARLSGGEAQRLAIARALAPEPRLLLLDEPTGPLDRRLREHLLDLVAEVHGRFGTTTVHVTHDYDECFRLSARVLVIVDGRLVQQGPVEDLYARPRTRQVAELSGAVSFVRVRGRDGDAVTTTLGTCTAHGAEGTEVLVALRTADGFLVEPTDDGAPANVEVTGCRPAPGCFLVTVRTDDGDPVRVEHPSPLAPGTAARLTLRGDAWLVPA